MTRKSDSADKHSQESLKLRRVAIDTYKENVAYLNRNCEVYRAEGFQSLNKVLVTANGQRIYAVLNVVDDDSIVGANELGLSEQAFTQIGMDEGRPVAIAQAGTPKSMESVRRKIHGERLHYEDLLDITHDIADHRLSKMEMAAFVVAVSESGMDREEVMALTRAMTESGDRMDWNEPLVVDKHCIGGLPGNRTTMIIVPILAAHGMLVPKTSSRAITSPAGTADTMEVLAEVDLTPSQLHKVVRKHHACLAWGGNARLAPVDDILISVERPLGLDSPEQMVASILSKKLAAGATHLLIDIPVGPTAKVRHMRQALTLRKLFEYVGDRLGVHLEVIITDGSQPIGRGIGPVLEVRDVLEVLNNDVNAATDLREKSLRLAGRVLEFDPDVRGGYGYSIARDILESGRAMEKMDAIIDAQGRHELDLRPGKLQHDIVASDDGVVTVIDNSQLAKIARLAGAPMDKRAGVDLFKKLGDKVSKGDALYRIHAEFTADYHFSCAEADNNSGYQVGELENVSVSYMDF